MKDLSLPNRASERKGGMQGDFHSDRAPSSEIPPKSNEGQASGELRSPWPTAFPFATLHFLLQTKGKLPRSQPANDEFAVAQRRGPAESGMNTARGIFGAVLAAGALAAIATFYLEFWPPAQSPPQQMEAVQKSLARPETATQEFADFPKSVHTVPVTRPAPEQPTPAPPATRVAANPPGPATLPSHAEPVDVCARNGGRRVDFMRGHHAMWRCVYPRRR